MIKHFHYDFFYVGDQVGVALLHNWIVILIVHGIMVSPCGTRRARYHGQPKSICMIVYSIVIGDYYSGDARYLVVNEFTAAIITGYRLVMDYASHGYLFSADCPGSVQ